MFLTLYILHSTFLHDFDSDHTLKSIDSEFNEFWMLNIWNMELKFQWKKNDCKECI